MKKIVFIVIVLFPLSLFPQVRDHPIEVHLYPHSLSPQDSLRDGPFGKKIDIPEDAFLIWVDPFDSIG